MEIRSLGEAKTQLESQHDVPVVERVKQLQASFMKATGNCAEVNKFYVSHIEPLFEQKMPYENLQQIETQFTRLIELFKTTKGIDADILEGYCHVLTLYKFFVCFQFLQIDRGPRSSSGPEATSPTSPVSPTSSASPITSPLVMSPQSPLAPASTVSPTSLPSPKPQEKKFSTGFTKIQSASAQRNLLEYKSNLKKWEETPFSFSENEWKEQAHALNEEIRVFNRELKNWLSAASISSASVTVLSSSSPPGEKKLELDELETLFQEEENFAILANRLEEVTREQKRLTEQCDQFGRAKDAAILLFEKNDNLHCNGLKAAPIQVGFSTEEISQLGDTNEIKSIASFYGKKFRKCERKTAELKGLEKGIGQLQADLGLLDKPFSQKNILGKLWMPNRIFALLREFKTMLELMLSKYKKSLQEILSNIEAFRKAKYQAQASEINAIKKILKRNVLGEVKDEIQSLKKEAVLCRKKERVKYVTELSSQFGVVAMDEVSSLNETHKQRENQLDSRWELGIKKIIEDYRNYFLGITIDIGNIGEREKIQDKIQELENFYLKVELRRYRLISRGNQLNCPRKDKIFAFFVPFERFLKDIDRLVKLLKVKWIHKQIEFYWVKYRFLQKLNDVDTRILELEGFLKEIQTFRGQYSANFDELAVEQFQELTTRVGSQLSYESKKKAKNKEKTQKIGENILSQITNPQPGVDILQNAKREIADWRKEETATIRQDLRGRQSLEQKLRRIQGPMRQLDKDITNCPVPEYSCFWATVWSLICCCFVYEWWYQRKCRLAVERHMKERLKRTVGSGHTSQEGSASSSPTAVSRATYSQDQKFSQAGIINEDVKQIGSSSGKMILTMRSLRPQPLTLYPKRQKEVDYSEEPFEICSSLRRKIRKNKRTAEGHPLKRSTTDSSSQYQRYQKTRQRLYDLTSPNTKSSSSLSANSMEERRSNTAIGKTSLLH